MAPTPPPPTPPLADPSVLGDPFRLASLRESGLLHGVADPVLDRVARIASAMLGVPKALVSLVDDAGQHLPGMAGVDGWVAEARGTSLSYSFCQHVVAEGRPFVVEDASQHALVRDNLGHRELGVVAYAGVPLTTTDGDTLGALCAVDTIARRWTAEQLAALRELAAIAMTEIELRRTVRALAESEERLAATESRLTRALRAARMGTWEWDLVADRREHGDECGPILGLTAVADASTLDGLLALVHPDDRLAVRAAVDDALAGRADYDVRYRVRAAAGEWRLLHDVGSVTRDETGRAVRMAGTVREVTPPRR